MYLYAKRTNLLYILDCYIIMVFLAHSNMLSQTADTSIFIFINLIKLLSIGVESQIFLLNLGG